MGLVLEVTDATFERDVLQSPVPVVVDFWAEWCGPCRMMAPILADLAAELEGKFRFLKLDVDQNPSSTTQFGIQSIPTLLVFAGGRPVAQRVGALSKESLKAVLEESVAKS